MLKRFAALLLALLMCVSLVPTASAWDWSVNPTPPSHEHYWTESERVEPTCTSDGYVIYTCYCGASSKTVIPMLGHEMGEWVTIREATETQLGIRERYCVRSDKTETEYFTVSGEPYACPVGLTKKETSMSPNINGYVAGDTITYVMTVTNYSSMPITNVVVRDDTFDVTVDTYAYIDPNDWRSLSYSYTVKESDMTKSYLTNNASATFLDASGKEGICHAACTVALYPDNPSATITLEEVSSPKGTVYVENEPVELKYVINVGPDADLEEGIEVLNGDHLGHMPAGATFIGYHTYYVTYADCVAGGIDFDDCISALYRGTGFAALSNAVHVKCGFEGEPSVIAISKQVTNIPACGYYSVGDEIEYLISIKNLSENVQMTATVYDNDVGASFLPATIPAGMNQGHVCTHVVTAADVKKGSFTNTASVQYLFEDGDNGVLSSSPVTVQCKEEEPQFLITKTILNPPSYSNAYYVEGETLYYMVRVEYQGTKPAKATICDPMCWTSDKTETFDPGDVNFYNAEYTVKPGDVPGSIINTAAVTSNGKTWYDSVTVETGEGEFAPTDVILVKSVSPASIKSYPSGYGEGDIIIFDLILFNASNYSINDVEITDPFVTDMPLSLGHIAAGDFATASIGYTVTKKDVDAHQIANTAYASFQDEGATHCSVMSNTVVVPTTGGAILNGEDDPCKTILRGTSDNAHAYEQDYCSLHDPIREQAEEILDSVENDAGLPAAYDEIRALWFDAVEELYTLWFQAVEGDDLAAAKADRTAFMQMLADYETSQQQWRKGNEAYIAEGLARLAEEKCTELCYELYTVPEERPDSWETENVPKITEAAVENCVHRVDEIGENSVRYTEINCEPHLKPMNVAITTIDTVDDEVLRENSWILSRQAAEILLAQSYAEIADKVKGDEEKQLVMQDYSDFMRYIRSRETVLKTMLYPDNNKTVQEILCREILNRLAMNCGDIAEQATGTDLKLESIARSPKSDKSSQDPKPVPDTPKPGGTAKKSSTGWIIGGCAGGVAAIGAAAFVLIKKKKK